MTDPHNSPEIPYDALSAIEHDLRDPQTELAIAREMATADPEHMRQLGTLATRLYPDDLQQRIAFMRGSEASHRIERQVAAEHDLALRIGGAGAAEPAKRRRLFKKIGAHAALISLAVFHKPKGQRAD